VVAVLSLGSNRGDRRAHLRAAVEVLRSHAAVLATSPVYETEPVGMRDQDAFLNCVVVLDTDDPEAALSAAHAAEETRGRLRSRRWGPRTLDVDVVSVDAVVRADPRLTLPHPRAAERAFVLRPWLDLDPEAWLPGRGPVRALLHGLDEAVVRKVGRL
jgi:2-amino-4-hydroxy-6-hydroxymethyldihydropteridine diphosphokinase